MNEFYLKPNNSLSLLSLSDISNIYSFPVYEEKVKWNGKYIYILDNEVFDRDEYFHLKSVLYLPVFNLQTSQCGIIDLKKSIYDQLLDWEQRNNDTIYLKKIVITRFGKEYKETYYRCGVYPYTESLDMERFLDFQNHLIEWFDYMFYADDYQFVYDNCWKGFEYVGK